MTGLSMRCVIISVSWISRSIELILLTGLYMCIRRYGHCLLCTFGSPWYWSYGYLAPLLSGTFQGVFDTPELSRILWTALDKPSTFSLLSICHSFVSLWVIPVSDCHVLSFLLLTHAAPAQYIRRDI